MMGGHLEKELSANLIKCPAIGDLLQQAGSQH